MNRNLTLGSLLFLAACGGEDTEKTAESQAALTAICLDEAAPADAWICGDERVVECRSPQGTEVDLIYVSGPPDDEAFICEEDALIISDPGPYAPGEHVIVVQTVEDDEAVIVCESNLTVVDTTPPVVEARTVELWPPNHKMERVSPRDCLDVFDACDDDVEVAFTWVTSDEPENATGDGNTEPDIVDAGCDGASIRQERQGGGDGRVYTFGWVAWDDAGNTTDGTCRFVIPHDQSGRSAQDSGAAYRADWDTCGPDDQ